MGKLKIRFHPLFIIYVFLCLYFGWFNAVFFYVVSVVLHEYGHYFMARHLGYETNGILFSVYGAGLNTNNAYKIKDDIKISLSGPLVNLGLIILIVCFWWIIPSTYYFTYDLFVSNLVIMLYNLIPIYPLDGGRVIVALLSGNVNKRRVMKVNSIICFIFGMLFLIMFFVSIFLTINFNLLFTGLFFALNSIMNDKSVYFDRIKAYNKSSKKVQEVKVFKVDNMDKSQMLKYISPNYYTIFIRNDGNKQVIIDEEDLLKY